MAGDDIGGGFRLIPGVFQGAAGLPLLRPPLGQRLLSRGAVLLHSLQPLAQLLALRGGGGFLRPGVRRGGHCHGLPAPQGLRLGLGTAGLGRGCLGLFQQGIQYLVQFGDLHLQRPDLVLLLLRLTHKSAGAAGLIRQLRLCPVDVLLVVGHGALQHRQSGLFLLGPAVQIGGLRPDGLDLHVLFPHAIAVGLALGVQRIQRRTGAVPLCLGSLEVRFQFPGRCLEIIQILQPHGDLQKPQLIPQHQILLRLFRLLPQRLYL